MNAAGGREESASPEKALAKNTGHENDAPSNSKSQGNKMQNMKMIKDQTARRENAGHHRRIRRNLQCIHA